jgi:hypothetical protein
MPLRPLTFGELLDSAIALLRTRPNVFLGAAFVLAALEQGWLFPLRHLVGTAAPSYLPYAPRLGAYWLVFSFGLATEALTLALLGGFTGAAAGSALLGQPLSNRDLLHRVGRRTLPLVVVALLVALLAGVGALAAMVPWIFLYGLVGLAAPALMIDRVGPFGAIGRSFTLASRAGMRATWLRLGGYLSWLAIRMALGFGGTGALGLVLPDTEGWAQFTSITIWLLVNTIAYAALACFDAILYLETRMRTEGLDIAVGRAVRLGRPVDLSQSAVLDAPEPVRR